MKTPVKIDPQSLLKDVEQIARDAGAEIMRFYEDGATIYTKADESPVTEADYAAERLILPRLAALLEGVPLVSEEAVSAGYKPDVSKGTFWTVDPLDGTKEFINRTGAFVVAISLVVDNKPVLGVIYHPALGIMYSAAGPGTAAREGPDGERVALGAGVGGTREETMRVVLNESSTDMPKVKGYLTSQFNTASPRIDPQPGVLRACQVADNSADMSVIYPTKRDGRTKWWDVAPAHAIVEAAGGIVQTVDGKPVVYDADDFMVPPVISISPNRASATPAAKPPENKR
jgi:3'(2'), 5'-bisphosphate nucleotidase